MGKITNSIRQGIQRAFASAGESFSTWMTTASRYRAKRQFLRLYRGIVWACINAIGDDVAKYQPIFNRKDNRNGKLTQVQHEFMQVLERPNNRMTSKFDLFFATQAFIELVGNAYWYLSVEEKSRKVREIYVMRPDRVKICTDKNSGDVIGYTS